MPSTRELLSKLEDVDQLIAKTEAAVPQEMPDFGVGAFPIQVGGDEAGPTSGPVPEGGAFPSEEVFAEHLKKKVLEAGGKALKKVKTEGADVQLDPEELVGLEAIVQENGRPAIIIQGGKFFPAVDQWQILESVRPQIESNLQCVGRIELNGHMQYEWCGTGFLVSSSVIMTNRHVANIFCEMGFRRRWRFQEGVTAQIDYVEELGSTASVTYALTSVIGVHDKLDMALFRIERIAQTGQKLPKPLSVTLQAPILGGRRKVYTVGYPAWDGRRNDPEIMRKIFANIFDVKRLQPGELMNYFGAQKVFTHDCSTLGGNSGSAVFDLETHKVLGLHFGGKYMQGNYAVALWDIVNDPMVRRARINYQ